MDINSIMGSRPDINEMISKIREVSNKSKVFSEVGQVNEPGGFEGILSAAKGAVSQVDRMQSTEEAVKTAYITGDPSVSMSQVIVASQKSKLAFEGLVSVRNKILEAYREIMNMQV